MQVKEELLDIEGIKNSKKSLIDLFIRRTSVLTSTREDIVELIIKDQWKRANKIASEHNNIAEIDFPNLGMFYISKNKARNKINKLELGLTTIESKEKKVKKIYDPLEDRQTYMKDLIGIIKKKIKTNETES